MACRPGHQHLTGHNPDCRRNLPISNSALGRRMKCTQIADRPKGAWRLHPSIGCYRFDNKIYEPPTRPKNALCPSRRSPRSVRIASVRVSFCRHVKSDIGHCVASESERKARFAGTNQVKRNIQVDRADSKNQPWLHQELFTSEGFPYIQSCISQSSRKSKSSASIRNGRRSLRPRRRLRGRRLRCSRITTHP